MLQVSDDRTAVPWVVLLLPVALKIVMDGILDDFGMILYGCMMYICGCNHIIVTMHTNENVSDSYCLSATKGSLYQQPVIFAPERMQNWH